ncbi:MAG: hypothetical protein J1E00_04690 [Oscillospiraceae bacterium]|nr:hypothetical protein [Oscillospiraceae bacterium]
MKERFLIFLLVLLTIFSSGCSRSNDDLSSASPESSDRSITASENTLSEDVTSTYKDLGAPQGSRYSTAGTSIRVLDMYVLDGMLYVGGGNWNVNSGPVDMWRYCIAQEEWEQLGSVPDEEVNEFVVLNGVLTVPGTDARQDGWDLCNYYYLENDEWKVKRTIPNSSHCWDIAAYDGKLFAAVEYEADHEHYYVAVSEDNGNSFGVMPLLDQGAQPVKSGPFGRYYHLLTIDHELYAFCSGMLYQYDGSQFVFAADWSDKVTLGSLNGVSKDLSAAVNIGTTLYFSSTKLYACSSADSLREIELPNGGTVNDLYVYNDELYVLSIKTIPGENSTSVIYKYGQDAFTVAAELKHEIPAACLAVTEDKIYLGMASNLNHNDNGRVFEIEKNH